VTRRHFWHATHDCVAPYVDIILHRGRFWAKSAASGSIRWWGFRSCWTVLSHVMRRRPSRLLQYAGGEANRILLASALSSMHIICPNRVSRHDWIIAVSLGCFVSIYIIIPYKLVPFDAKQHTQTPLVEWLMNSLHSVELVNRNCGIRPNLGPKVKLWSQRKTNTKSELVQ